MAKEDFRFHFSLRVRWAECDGQGIVFFGRYTDYVEVAQAEYYRNLGIRLYDEISRVYFDIATVKLTMEFMAPARADELLDIYARVSRVGLSSITMETEMYRQESSELLNKAEIIFVDYDATTQTSRRVPDDVRSLVDHFEDTGETLPIDRFPNLRAR